MDVPICRCGVALVKSFAAGNGSYEPCYACRRTAWQQGWHSRDRQTRPDRLEAMEYRIPWDGQMSGLSEFQAPLEAVGKTVLALCAKCGHTVAAMWDYKNDVLRTVPCIECYFAAKSEAHADLLKSESLRKLFSQTEAK